MPIPLFALKLKISLPLLLKVQSLIKIVTPFVLAHYSNAKTYAMLNINQPLIGASFGQGKRWLHTASAFFHSSNITVLCSPANLSSYSAYVSLELKRSFDFSSNQLSCLLLHPSLCTAELAIVGNVAGRDKLVD